MANPLLAIDLKREERRITAFIRRIVARSGARGVVVGLSGGVDSAVVFALCVRALGRDGVLAALFPSKHTPPGDTEDAVRLADEWGTRRVSVAISPLVDALISAAGSGTVKLAHANVQARVRMTILYYLANSRGLLVVGTGDRSEELLGFFCYDDKTRVVTIDGPKGIDELAAGDIVFSLDPPTRHLVEVPVKEVFQFNYRGKMIQFRSRSTDLLVTPNHRMLIQTSTSNPKSRLVFRTAEECLRLQDTVTPLPSGWIGTTSLPRTIEITFSQRHIRRTIRMAVEDAFYLFGLFIGDGSAVKGRTTVPVRSRLTRLAYNTAHRDSQGRFVMITEEAGEPHMKTYDTFETIFSLPGYTKPEARMRLIDILDRYGIGHSYTRDTVRIQSRGIYDVFVQCGVGARNKHIPRWVLTYPSEYLLHLLYGLKDSDGSHADRQNVYYTSSEKLKDDFVQLCFKLGRRATARLRGARSPVIKGKTINTGPSYEISFQGGQHHQRIVDNRYANVVEHDGRVWCPSVPPYENILVERNGKYMFSGNTKFGDGGADFLPIAHLYKTQVRLMGKHLGIPPGIVSKPASPQLWPGHTAEEELPAGYEKLDIVMRCLFDAGGSVPRAATEGGVSRTVVHRVLEMNGKSAHKRALPPSLRPSSG